MADTTDLYERLGGVINNWQASLISSGIGSVDPPPWKMKTLKIKVSDY